MPSLLSPSGSGTMSYAPLADPSPDTTPVVPPLGLQKQVYPQPSAKTVPSTSTISSTGSSDDGDGSVGYSVVSREAGSGGIRRSGSDDTLNASLVNNRSHPADGDIGDIRRATSPDGVDHAQANGYGRHTEQGYGYRDGKVDLKGKGRESTWDIEQGRDNDSVYGAQTYPPTNEEEDEERRVQDNLARMAARDQARRRASRNSKTLSMSPDVNGGSEGFSSSTAYPSRPSSMFSLNRATSKRSIMGLMDGVWGSGGKRTSEAIPEDGELPLSNPGAGRGESPEAPYPNPYATRPAPGSPRQAPPTMVLSPASPTGPNPFSDPLSNTHKRNESTSTTGPGLRSPTSPTEEGFAYGYAGPGWRGGAAANSNGQTVAPKPEKWWHAFCAWGDDLDGNDNDDGQAGRTNPFE